MYKLFMSYCFDDVEFVGEVTYYLSLQADLRPFFYSHMRCTGTFREQLTPELQTSDYYVVFVGSTPMGQGQLEEVEWILGERRQQQIIVVTLPRSAPPPLGLRGRFDPVHLASTDGKWPLLCAQEIAKMLRVPFVVYDLPLKYLFDYEKAIIEEYVRGNGTPSLEKRMEGCPKTWPRVERDEASRPNPIIPELIGQRRADCAQILVDARTQYHIPLGGEGACCLVIQDLVFPEAGPREMLRYPLPPTAGWPSCVLNVGILVSGGIAPGINAVIAGIVDRHYLYRTEQVKRRQVPPKGRRAADYPTYSLSVCGYRDGFSGLLRGDTVTLTPAIVKDHANKGGSLIGTSRCHALLDMEEPRRRETELRRVVQKLRDDHIDILYVIGGDGSMSAAHALWSISRKDAPDLSIVAVPKTMDNDILWVWQAFGFLSAVEKAKDFVLQLHTEAKSNPRLCITQLFGSDSGFVVSHAALASGVCDAVLIPENQFTIDRLAEYVRERLQGRYRPGPRSHSPYAMILAGETTIPLDVEDYLDDPDISLEVEEKKAILAFLEAGRRVHGQTPDELRTGGLKILSRSLQKKIKGLAVDEGSFWHSFRVFTNEPRHLIRAIDPSVQDVIFGQRLGSLAVDNAMAGYTDFMISQWMTEYVLIPLKLVILGRKRVPREGIFWKSVLANTGQPEDLVGDRWRERQATEWTSAIRDAIPASWDI